MTGAPNYNDGLWHGWNGGECPVHPETVVEVVWLDKTAPKRETLIALNFVWDDEISKVVAFRVVKEHREPREWFVFVKEGFVVGHTVGRDDPDLEVVKVREVLE